MVLRLLCAILLVGASGGLVNANEGFFGFVVPSRMSTASAVRANWIDAPAGKHGSVVVRDAHFYAGERRIRFLGVNVAYAGCFPSQDDAEAIAAKLSQFGINLVRFHFLDAVSPMGLIAAKKPDTQTLDQAQLAKLDYFISRLKTHGIYSNLNLFCGHTFTAADGVADGDKLPGSGKYVSLFAPRLIELQKDFARKLLQHENPYTGQSYSREPAVALVEITNENSFLYGWSRGLLDELPPAYSSKLNVLFAEFLTKRGMTPVEPPRWRDKSPNAPLYIEFLTELESRYFREMHSFVKRDLGAQAPVTGTMAFGPAGARIMADMDFVDCHAYWEHPIYSEGDWKGTWTIRNTPMVANPSDNSLVRLAAVRVDAKPYTVSEYNHPFPSFYDAEAIPLAAAFAARQDWDALVIFDFSMSESAEQRSIHDFFQINGHPVKAAELLAASAIFVRGDLPPARPVQRDVAPPDKLAAPAAKRIWYDIPGLMADAGLSLPSYEVLHSLVFAGKPAASSGQTHDPAFRWSGDGKIGLMTADSPSSRACVGFFDAEAVKLGTVTLTLRPCFASVTVTALDGKPVESSARLLVTACGRSSNTGMQWNEAKNSLLSWGGPPSLAEGIAGRVELPGNLILFALGPDGAPARRLVSSFTGGATTFQMSPENATLWYLAIRTKQ